MNGLPAPCLVPIDTGVFDRISAHDINVGRTAFIPVTGSDGLHPFDEISGKFLDMDPSFAESVPNLPTGDPTTAVLFTSEKKNENRELVVSSPTDLFLYDLELNPPDFIKTVSVDGEEQEDDVRELVIEDNGRFGFFLHDDGKIGATQVQRFTNANGPNPPPIALADRLATFPSIASVMGRAAGLTASEIPHQGGGPAPKPRFALYVAWSCLDCVPTTTTACTDPIVLAQLDDGQQLLRAENTAPPTLPPGIRTPPAWLPVGGPFAISLLSTMLFQDCFPGTCSFYALPGEEGGGGGGGGYGSVVNREIWLSVRVVEANLDSQDPLLGPAPFWTPVCDKDFWISSETTYAPAPLWEPLGVALSPDKSRLYVVDPQDDMLIILDTRDITMVGSLITTGEHPFDVAAMVVDVPGGADVERVYVANHGHVGTPNDDTMTVIDPMNGTADSIDLNLKFPNLSDLSIERITASQSTRFLFLVSRDNDKFFILDANIDGADPLERGEFGVGPSPGRVAVQVVAP